MFIESTMIRSSSILSRLIATWKRRKSLMMTKSKEDSCSLKRCDIVVWHATIATSSSKSVIVVLHFFFSIASTYLLNYINTDVLIESSRRLHSLLIASQCLILIFQSLFHILYIILDTVLCLISVSLVIIDFDSSQKLLERNFSSIYDRIK